MHGRSRCLFPALTSILSDNGGESGRAGSEVLHAGVGMEVSEAYMLVVCERQPLCEVGLCGGPMSAYFILFATTYIYTGLGYGVVTSFSFFFAVSSSLAETIRNDDLIVVVELAFLGETALFGPVCGLRISYALLAILASRVSASRS